jgi:hypothetical protein
MFVTSIGFKESFSSILFIKWMPECEEEIVLNNEVLFLQDEITKTKKTGMKMNDEE